MKTADFLPASFLDTVALYRRKRLEDNITSAVDKVKKRHHLFQKLIEHYGINTLIEQIAQLYQYPGNPYFDRIQQHSGFGLFEGTVPNTHLSHLVNPSSVIDMRYDLGYYEKTILNKNLAFMLPQQIREITFDKGNLDHLKAISTLYQNVTQAPWVRVIATAGTSVMPRQTPRGVEGAFIEYALMRFALTPKALYIAGPNYPTYLDRGSEERGEGFWLCMPLKNLNINNIAEKLDTIHLIKADRGVYIGEVDQPYSLIFC